MGLADSERIRDARFERHPRSPEVLGDVDLNMAAAMFPLPLDTTAVLLPFATEPLETLAEHLRQPSKIPEHF